LVAWSFQLWRFTVTTRPGVCHVQWLLCVHWLWMCSATLWLFCVIVTVTETLNPNNCVNNGHVILWVTWFSDSEVNGIVINMTYIIWHIIIIYTNQWYEPQNEKPDTFGICFIEKTFNSNNMNDRVSSTQFPYCRTKGPTQFGIEIHIQNEPRRWC
jgi:hypothetical protein